MTVTATLKTSGIMCKVQWPVFSLYEDVQGSLLQHLPEGDRDSEIFIIM